MKKKVLAISVITLLLAVNMVAAKSSPNGTPFQAIWDAINNIQDQIDELVITGGEQGPQGPQGEPGEKGEKGDKGEPGEIPTGTLPTPAFTSEWIEIPSHTAVINIPHDIGGDINDYFIDVTYQRHNDSFMSHQTGSDKIWWEDVEPNNIQIATEGDVTNLFKAVRVRIWVVN